MLPLECALNILLVAQAALAAFFAVRFAWFPGSLVVDPLLLVGCAAVALLSTAAFVMSHWRQVALKRAIARTAMLQIEADTDILTGLANRRAFNNAIAASLARAVRERQSLSLIVIDIDHFKAFNDTYGHVEGDRALRAAAETIQAVMPPGARAYRIGGEEMAAILPATSLLEAAQQARLIQGAVEAMRRPHLRGVGGIVTVSIGVAEGFPAEAPLPPEILIEAADRALYEAKDAGRACVRLAAIAPQLPPEPDPADDSVDGLHIVLPNGSRLAINSRVRLSTVGSILQMMSDARAAMEAGAAPSHDAAQ